MSNLIKSVYFNVSNDNKVIIDSNSRLEKLPFYQTHVKNCESSIDQFEFIPGMNVLNIDQLMKDEKEKIQINSACLLDDTRKEADQILENARKEAARIKEDAYRDGKEKGYQDGLDDGKVDCCQIESNLKEKEVALKLEYDQLVRELEPKFADLVSGLIEGITGILVADKKEVISYLVHRSLSNVPKSDRYTLRVCKEDAYILESKKEELKNAIRENSLIEIAEDDSLHKNQCIIETDNQMIDCSLDVQLQKLTQEIKMLSLL